MTILIIGAGLGGLALAHSLRNQNIPFAIYERDPNPSSRSQGYRIRINQDGARALHTVVDEETWRLFEGTCAETVLGMSAWNAREGGEVERRAPERVRVRIAEGGERKEAEQPMGPYTVDRATLRQVLLSGLSFNVHFAKTFLRAETLPNGKIIAYFADGTTSVEGSFIVGADGVRSAVRKQYLPEHVPLDTKMRCIYGKTPITPELDAELPEKARQGIVLITDQSSESGDPLVLFAESVRFPGNAFTGNDIPPVKDYYYWVFGGQGHLFGMDGRTFLALSPSECTGVTLQMTNAWHPSLRALLVHQDPAQSSPLRIASMKPDIPTFDLGAPVTFVGDAIHCMSPAAGVGANTALTDAMVLAESIRRNGVGREAVREYEAEMRTYARESIEGSLKGGKNIFNQRPLDQCIPMTY
ncbi:FAD/NAD(P)-binding domain-containing protein [Saitoella complicata NRRL Y-17804]|uniref:FAD-binding domain-containing protein n=1 Tax=Saitoella complicata (strain BCRC 22490 / CBS 7301 / JCM 7358 / NBRC 10748 / NRRL Y-17804) TaxID=698492 RepID=A0A0E9NGA2_SAICN|nr:FAD/NAD(P)-binding domain-containing protein [Saitoella complicata NRRL Y-17804]ODQ53551.1 FAD/NAD(P)-binding domain-containing protein [Saitoella complicata NRRL Y-17804]GAO48731.1 hypothetical protein G7K_2901-t1 [Saitoella complicata NRRL Y-17804]